MNILEELFTDLIETEAGVFDAVADDEAGGQAEEEDEQGKALVGAKAIKRKSPELLAEACHKFFRHQFKAVGEKIVGHATAETKSLPSDWFDLAHWTDEMFKALRPAVALYFDFSAKQTVARLGGSLDLFNVVQPKLSEGVDKATLLFCKETNEATSLELSEAIGKLRGELTEGLVEGDVKQAMMERVKNVFDLASNERAWRIGVTEASRGQHAAQFIVAKESGIVTGKRWLLSSEACPECQPLAGKVVGLEENFTTRGEGPYSEIPWPPLHPHCRCDAIEIVPGVND